MSESEINLEKGDVSTNERMSQLLSHASAIGSFISRPQAFSNLQPDLDTADGRGAAVERHARAAFEEIVGT